MAKFRIDSMMKNELHYNMELPEKVTNILETDFWVLEQFDKGMLPVLADPIKFTSNVSIFLKSGECQVDIDLITHDISAPCVVNIRRSQILQLKSVSEDFDSSFIVMSKRFCDNLFVLLQDCKFYHTAVRRQVVPIPHDLLGRYKNLYSRIGTIFRERDNPFSYQAMALALSSFFYEVAYKCYSYPSKEFVNSNNRTTCKFIFLVQKYFKEERFLKFYAEQLGISPKHLSRIIKNETGFSAVEWIERYVILEAKVLLKSTNLNIQQVSDELNFPSQSFFGKYFKKKVGMSPKEFRNT
ncbi:MAG: helix-turn-helix domain-containing protein [Muribaculaceae bacterium]|nr:helix-turn-helix domain-containing protein [Muribaculaceae bacterium]